MLPADRLYERCEDSLAAIEGYYASTPGAVKLPDRRFVSAGIPVYDCELLAVWSELFEAHEGELAFSVQTAAGPRPGGGLLVGSFVASIVRCTPAVLKEGGKPPSVEQEMEAAAVLYADAIHMHRAMMGAARAGIAGCKGLMIVGWTLSQGQLQAGFGGGELRYRLALND